MPKKKRVKKMFKKGYEFLEKYIEPSDFAKGVSERNAKILQSFDFRYEKRNHWASDFGRCRTFLWYYWNGEKQKYPVNMVSIDRMQEGKDIEKTVIEKMKRDGIFITSDVPILVKRKRPSYDISGKIDAVTYDPDNLLTGDILIVEIKSSKDFGERQSFNMWKRYLPSLEHTAQLMCYLDATGKKKGELWYVNINRAVEQTYSVKHCPQLMKIIHEFFDGIEKDIVKKNPPAIEHRRGGYPCSWYSKDPKHGKMTGHCPYYHKCWGNMK